MSGDNNSSKPNEQLAREMRRSREDALRTEHGSNTTYFNRKSLGIPCGRRTVTTMQFDRYGENLRTLRQIRHAPIRITVDAAALDDTPTVRNWSFGRNQPELLA